MANINIKEISNDIIEILGVTYYTESYLKEMMLRERYKGLLEGRQVFVAEFKEIF